MFGISMFPTLVLLPGGAKDSLVYDGEMKKKPIVAFLGQIVPPNPDPAPKPRGASSSTKPKATKSSSSSSSAFSKVSASHKSAEASEAAASGSTIVLEDFDVSESPTPIVPPSETPITVPDAAPPISTLVTPAELHSACIDRKTGTCVLALLPSQADAGATPPEPAAQVLTSLAAIANKHVKRKAKLFPFYAVPAENKAAKALRDHLGLKPETEFEMIAINIKREWFTRFSSEDTGIASVESFIDAIKLGDGKKDPLREGINLQPAEKEADHDEL